MSQEKQEKKTKKETIDKYEFSNCAVKEQYEEMINS